MEQQKQIVIDGKGHLLGRLASIVAKQLLCGKRIVVVRAEELNVSGSFFRLKMKYNDFLKKRHLTNPRRNGPFHLRSPSKMFWRTVRGMLPHKTARGTNALKRMKVFEGIPPKYAKLKRTVVPPAMRVLRLQPNRAYSTLGRLSHEVGWKYQHVIQALESKRKEESSAYYESKTKIKSANTSVIKDPKKKAALEKIDKELAQLGYC